MLLNNPFKEFILVFKDKERNPLPLSDKQVDVFRNFLSSTSARFIDFRDDNGNYQETIAKNEIRGIEKRRGENREMSKYRWICSYGSRHRWEEGCDCKKVFNCLGFEMWDMCKKLKPDLIYDSDITPELQKAAMKYLK